MDAAEYKHVVLGLIFLKYISDAFEAKHAELEAQQGEGADPEDPDEYRAMNIFWVPPEARWRYLKSMAPQPADRAKDTLGRVYEYFLSQFASAEGKKGGQFYTPSHVVRVLVVMLAPYKGRV